MEEREKDRENEERSAVFDENGKVKPWILDSFQQFLSGHFQNSVQANVKSKGEVTKRGEVVRSEHHLSASNIEENIICNKDSPDFLHSVSSTQTVEERNQRLFKLLEEAATKGVSVLQDENFVQYCTKVMNFDDDQQKTKEHSETSHPSSLGVNEEGLDGMTENGGAKSVEQGKEISRKKKNSLGPKDKDPTGNDHRTPMGKATVGKGQVKSTSAEIPAGSIVHNVLSPCKVQPTCSFAEIAKKGQSAQVISKQTSISLLHNPNSCKSSPTSRDDSPIFRISPEVLAKRGDISQRGHSLVA